MSITLPAAWVHKEGLHLSWTFMLTLVTAWLIAVLTMVVGKERFNYECYFWFWTIIRQHPTTESKWVAEILCRRQVRWCVQYLTGHSHRSPVNIDQNTTRISRWLLYILSLCFLNALVLFRSNQRVVINLGLAYERISFGHPWKWCRSRI